MSELAHGQRKTWCHLPFWPDLVHGKDQVMKSSSEVPVPVPVPVKNRKNTMSVYLLYRFSEYSETENSTAVTRTRSLSDSIFFIFDHVTFIQFKIMLLCTKFHQNRMIFHWDNHIDFKNGGRPPSWNCFTTIGDHPRSLCCWPQLPVKFHVNLVHRSEDIAIWIFRIVGLNHLFRTP